MKARRTGQSPPVIENLGDETFFYNFEIVETEEENEQGVTVIDFEYSQVRCDYPVDKQEIQKKINQEYYNHTVII